MGALVKPQFALYVALLPFVERSRKVAVVKTMAVSVAVITVYLLRYMLLRPAEWNEYVQAVVKRTVVEKDFGWGPAAPSMRFMDGVDCAARCVCRGLPDCCRSRLRDVAEIASIGTAGTGGCEGRPGVFGADVCESAAAAL